MQDDKSNFQWFFLQILNNFDRIHLEMVLTAIVFIIFGFLLGSIPFSVLLGRLFRHTDIRTYGDGNPGAANAFKAGGMEDRGASTTP